MSATTNIHMLTRYKAWANQLIFSALGELPPEETLLQRRTRFGNMVHTLNHVYVIDAVFQAHLQGRPHAYTERNTPTHPPLAELWHTVQALDQWYMAYAESLSEGELEVSIPFEFIGGGDGVMTRGQMLLHIVNHGSYHRGFVGDMMYQAGALPPATDMPVFLREHP
ncbi:putative damage-inducible protein DinB [Oxalobacteraceae bacterium GrIS 1.11]